ncbi:gluconate 2-dehydrogenase subunit 3 family protein [Stenotrophomonas sp.]|uniref:gluconate 2-dehydrogenase subunit 3 family protein n=1 Tax=Stenotrophomonas sp. TaxID=69392 RepID=UPI002FC6F83D
MDRRELLKMIVAATGAAMIGLPALAQGQAPAAAAKTMFSATEVGTLDEIAETILPRTTTPGAKEAAAGAFMAQFVTDCYTARQQATFRAGLADIDKRAGGRFVSLAAPARAELLRALDAEAKARAVEVTETGTAEEGDAMPHYFTMIKQLAIFGFFTSKVGATEVLRYVAVPGRYDGDLAYVPGTPAWGTG